MRRRRWRERWRRPSTWPTPPWSSGMALLLGGTLQEAARAQAGLATGKWQGPEPDFDEAEDVDEESEDTSDEELASIERLRQACFRTCEEEAGEAASEASAAREQAVATHGGWGLGGGGLAVAAGYLMAAAGAEGAVAGVAEAATVTVGETRRRASRRNGGPRRLGPRGGRPGAAEVGRFGAIRREPPASRGASAPNSI
ncbi:unnamed protein product [Prorocentrum cordatum]|uniref:Uncharacterized protein n=1 Tax=Prorocentrum cordatum TaxID=2364126 RepID=A0ABN9R652_9DINO|nr:unnamed protein product [Polarella glacialis]